jgi:hypothetical protein
MRSAHASTRRAAAFALAAVLIFAAACTPSTSTTQRMPIGAACATSGQCGTGAYYCDVGEPSGYCTVTCNSDGNCPSGSVCAGVTMLTAGICRVTCAASTTTTGCRAGYDCLTAGASHDYCAPPPATDGSTRD